MSSNEQKKVILDIIEDKQYNIPLEVLTDFQRDVYYECLMKKEGCLVLPMGSGKTLISLCVALEQVKKYPGSKIIIIMSKVLIFSWVEEIKKFFGNDLDYEIVHSEFMKNLSGWYPKAKIIITTPQVLSTAYKNHNVENFYTHNERKSFGPEIKYYNIPSNPFLNHKNGDGCFFSVKWGAMIVDEPHNYYNIKSKRSVSISSLSSHYRWLLSGTVLPEPKPKNIFGFYLMLNDQSIPRNFPQFKDFISSANYKGISNTFVKRDKNPNFLLPKINKVIQSHSLTPTEAKIYMEMKQLLNILRKKLEESKRNKDTVNGKKFSSYIVAMITYMRLCLVCPLIPIKSVISNTSNEGTSEISEMFVDVINKMSIGNWLNDPKSLYSSRIQAVCQKINDHLDEKIIIFSCYRKVIDLLRQFIPGSRQVFTITGKDTINTRGCIINDFRESDNGILLLTYEIGANGLNLQCASTVILVDFWWNDAKTNQAISRIIRPGQESKLVNIYYFTSNTGIENAIFGLQSSKISMGKEILTGAISTSIETIKLDRVISLINKNDNIKILNKIIS